MFSLPFWSDRQTPKVADTFILEKNVVKSKKVTSNNGLVQCKLYESVLKYDSREFGAHGCLQMHVACVKGLFPFRLTVCRPCLTECAKWLQVYSRQNAFAPQNEQCSDSTTVSHPSEFGRQ